MGYSGALGCLGWGGLRQGLHMVSVLNDLPLFFNSPSIWINYLPIDEIHLWQALLRSQ